MAAVAEQICRFCAEPLSRTFVDLGLSPLCQTVIEDFELGRGETYYPLHVFICDNCLLVQLLEYVSPDEIFSEYAYFSSYIDTLVTMAAEYADAMTERFGLGDDSRVIEIASNDGYLLQHFVKKGIPVLGIEPAANVAAAAEEKGVTSLVRFFGVETARALVADGVQADLLLGNNVLAARPRSARLRRRREDPGQAQRHHHVRLPAPDADDGRQPVRHHLSGALLVPDIDRRQQGLRPSRADDLRRRGIADARWFDSGICPSRRGGRAAGERSRRGHARGRGCRRAQRSGPLRRVLRAGHARPNGRCSSS